MSFRDAVFSSPSPPPPLCRSGYTPPFVLKICASTHVKKSQTHIIATSANKLPVPRIPGFFENKVCMHSILSTWKVSKKPLQSGTALSRIGLIYGRYKEEKRSPIIEKGLPC